VEVSVVVVWYFFFFFFLRVRVCSPLFFAFVAHFVFLREVWIRTQRAAIASRRATTHLHNLATHLPI
jgi:hypothetical protein